MSYCYIDYSKQNEIDLSVDQVEIYKEIKISGLYADIYFSISKSDISTSLIENSRFVLLIDGALESKGMTPVKLLELFSNVEINEVLDKVEGVFSLILYDKSKDLFYLSRDHFGLTPLYYYDKEDVLLFSNTLKAFKHTPIFKKEIDFNTLGQYLQHGYILQPHTIFQNCYKVKSAHIMKFDLSTKAVHQEKYWDIIDFYNKPRVKMSEEEILKESEKLLKSAIKAKVGSSKKVGSFLSGGYDSSAIASILSVDKTSDLHSYTVGFDDSELDEAPFAKEIADHLKTEHNEYYFNADYLEKILLRFAKVYDEPISDMAALPTMHICDRSSMKVDILFGGEGGDEIFASSSFINQFNKIHALPYPIKFIYSKVLKFFSSSTKYKRHAKILEQKNIENILKYKDLTLCFDKASKLIKAPIVEQPMDFSDSNLNPASHHLDKIFPLILKSYVSSNLLTKISFAASAYHVRPKLPYLDRKFVEFLATVDLKVKRKNGINKYILNKILQKYLPSKLMDRPKKGFNVPAGEILRDELKVLLDRYINEDRLAKEGIFNPNEVMKLKKRFLNSNSYGNDQNIWSILIFQLWYEHWFSE